MVIKKDICNALSDQEIIQKSYDNLDYFACLYDRYEPKLLRYIQKISMADPEEAADILQEAFIKIWVNLNSYDDRLKLSSWLYRIVHNETISFCRKKRSFGKNNKSDPQDLRFDELPDEADMEVDPEMRFFLTHEILNKLALKYREVLVLKFMEKMSYEEISDVLKIPEGTVATRMNRAKKMFKTIAKKENISFIG
jgi:RNA polymerase sigma-70 factor (ECF subfamily)